jgi:flagellar biosynthesis chaperone FliJ
VSIELWQVLASKQEWQRQKESDRQLVLQHELNRVRERREYIESVINDCVAQKRGKPLSAGQFSTQSSYLRQVLAMKHELQSEEGRIRAAIEASGDSVRVHAREEKKYQQLRALAEKEQNDMAAKLETREADEVNIALFNRSKGS